MFSAEKLSKDSELMVRLLDKMNGFFRKLDGKRENDGLKDFDDFDEAVDFLSRKIQKMNMASNMEDRITFIIFNSVFDLNIAKSLAKSKYLVKQVPKRFEISDSMLQAYTLVDLVHLLFARFSENDNSKFVPTICKLVMDHEVITEDTFLALFDEKEELSDIMEQHFAYSEEALEKFNAAAAPFLAWLDQCRN